jgi:hypothetical protein
MEVKKTCHSCGADVTHAARHKNRHGEYLCSKCLKARRQSSRERSHERRRTKVLHIVFWVVIAVVASVVFFEFLRVVHDMSDLNP